MFKTLPLLAVAAAATFSLISSALSIVFCASRRAFLAKEAKLAVFSQLILIRSSLESHVIKFQFTSYCKLFVQIVTREGHILSKSTLLQK